MPPRTPSWASVSLSSTTSPASSLERALLACQSLSPPSSARSFSSTSNRPKRNITVRKARFLKWMKDKGSKLKYHKRGETNYLIPFGRNPFPTNPTFFSEPVLSESAREMIYKRVFLDDVPIKVVSADYGVDHRRVAAVVRMKEIEKQWERERIPLAKAYSKAILEMLPTHHLNYDEGKRQFEPINEIHVHGYTQQQIFWPVSESRHFTREDAAKAFHHNMLSADSRMPHREFVEYHRRIKDGMTSEQSRQKFIEEARESQAKDEERFAMVGIKEKKITTTVTTPRYEFRFKSMTVDDVGKDGRARGGVGWRYGFPFEDRKRNQIKIPTKIE